MQYSQVGSWTAIAGVIAIVLAHIGISIDSATIVQTIGDVVKVIGDIAVIYGVIHQYFAHRTLAKAAGAFPR